MIELAFKLHSPITEEEWDLITDVDFDHTPRVMFHTKHGKDVEYVKVVRCKDCVFCCAYNEKWYMPKRDGLWCCREEKEVDTDDFCSRGAGWKNEHNY